MGFQFNHVGGGTKTRRPITLHMKYNSSCVQPNCFLITEDYGEQEVSLEELQVLTCFLKCRPPSLHFNSVVTTLSILLQGCNFVSGVVTTNKSMSS